MSESTKRMATSDVPGLATVGASSLPNSGTVVSPHLRRVRAVWRFVKGPAFIVVSALVVGVVVIVKVSGG